MEAHETKHKKNRRTKKVLDEAIYIALEKLIVEQGINNIKLTELAQAAGVEPAVIYNRYKDVDELVESYVRKYDFWLSDVLRLNTAISPKENLKQILVDLINDLYENEIMQRILLWELNDTSRITRRMAVGREIDSVVMLQYFNSELHPTKINLNTLASMLISCIYYLIMHRKVSTFCNINYDSQQGKEMLINATKAIVDALIPENKVKKIS